MENKKSFPFVFTIIAIIVGAALYKDINFKNLEFQKPSLDIVYLITFIISVFLIIRSFRNK